MFGDFKIADIIAYHCAEADIECRQELRSGIIVSERDYVSVLMTKIRTGISRHLPFNCHAQTIDSTQETRFGVDGIIVFQYGDEIKVGLFEAKRPQVTRQNYDWDYLSTRKISHFSEQIKKQRIWDGQLALWEMFFNEADNGYESPPYDYFGSSCVWHNNAFSFMHSEKLIFNKWTTDKLKKLLGTKGINFYTVIYNMISCQAGKKYKIDQTTNSCQIFSENAKEISLNIPIPTTNGQGQEKDRRIEQFLRENKLESFMHIDLTSKTESTTA
jgi:hypothetical protein